MKCRKCKDKGFQKVLKDGYEIVVPCECLLRKKTAQAIEAAGIPKRFRNYTLNRRVTDGRQPFKPLPPGKGHLLSERENKLFHDCQLSQAAAIRRLRELSASYLRFFIKGKRDVQLNGVLLSGPCGVGKTHLVATMLTDMVWAGLHDVKFVEYTHLMRQIRFSYSNKDRSESEILEPLAVTKVLVLDDLGAKASENTTWVQDILGYILNERYQSQLPTLVTTNYLDGPALRNDQSMGSEFLVDQIGVRLRSRLREMCPDLKMQGMDLRTLFANQHA